jgi:hypothetical protein
MRQITSFAVLAFSASFLMAQGGPPKETPPTGYLFNSLGGQKMTKTTGVTIDYYVQEGISTNNTIQKGVNGTPTGNANGGVFTPADADVPTFEQIEQFVHKDIKGSIIPGVTPTYAPMYKKVDWGFMADVLYGRQGGGGCRMAGFDTNWAMNATMSSADNTARNMWLCMPGAYFDLYVPVLKGVAIRLGRQGDAAITDEIPPNNFSSPNFFYSHSYGFYRTTQVMGGRISANILKSREYGLLMGEFVMHNGNGTVYSMSKKFDYSFALRYRNPKMDTWVDYSGRIGYGNVKTDSATGLTTAINHVWVADNISKYHLYSPNPQKVFENALSASKKFDSHWKATALIQFGKQFGDGASTTWAATTPLVKVSAAGVISNAVPVKPSLVSNFKGASYLSFEGKAIYTFNKKVSTALRLEEFRIPNGYFFPVSQFGNRGALNAMTLGANLRPNKYVNFRPEIRYDWQSGKYRKQIFGTTNPSGDTSDSQFFAGLDTVIYF